MCDENENCIHDNEEANKELSLLDLPVEVCTRKRLLSVRDLLFIAIVTLFY